MCNPSEEAEWYAVCLSQRRKAIEVSSWVNERNRSAKELEVPVDEFFQNNTLGNNLGEIE